jgi:hypothetical protein
MTETPLNGLSGSRERQRGASKKASACQQPETYSSSKSDNVTTYRAPEGREGGPTMTETPLNSLSGSRERQRARNKPSDCQ